MKDVGPCAEEFDVGIGHSLLACKEKSGGCVSGVCFKVLYSHKLMQLCTL